MPDATDMELLLDYHQHGSDKAFATLVERHVHLVYSAALRHTGIAAHAEEITQAAFIILARKAAGLRANIVLESWLYETTRLTALNFRRTERRRQSREQEAYMQSQIESETGILPISETEVWNQISSLLDDALARLGRKDREAVVLRFFNEKNTREVAATLQITEAAAQRRVHRAIEKLRKFFEQHGVKISRDAITGAISANSVQAAPMGMAAIISSTALSGTTKTTAAIVAATKAIAMTTFQKAIVTAALITTVGAGIFERHQAAQLRAQNQTLQQQQASLTAQVQQLNQSLTDTTNQLAGLLAENARLKSNPNSNEAELLKLRGEVAQLKNAVTQNNSDPMAVAARNLAAKVNRLKQYLDAHPDEKIPELQFVTADAWLREAASFGNLQTDKDFESALANIRSTAKNKFAFYLGAALDNYIANNNGQLPNDLSQLESYFKSSIDPTILQRYQLLHNGSLSDLAKDEPIIAEIAPVNDQYDTLYKIGAFSYSNQSMGPIGSDSGWFGTNITAQVQAFEKP